ncbi:MAG: FtsX-like permease family protein [Pirellulales bacterium]|nr:FtsX-like permease family protein [Pirellulales bacterium]
MSVLDKKLGREFWSSKWLLLAISLIITLGVGCYVGMATVYRSLQTAKTDYYSTSRMADFSIELKKSPLAEIEEIGRLPGVAAIRPRISFYTTVDLPDAVQPINGLVLSLPERRSATVNDIFLRRGSYFTDRRENEVIVNEAFAKRHKLSPGQWIHLVLNDSRQELFIVGTAISSEFVYLLSPGGIVPDPEHFGVFYLKQSYAQDVFDFDGAANQVLGVYSPGTTVSRQATLDEAERMLESYGVISTTPLVDQASNRYLSQEIDGLASFAVVMPIIFLGVAAVVLNVLLTRLAEQQRTIIGTLKALGFFDYQIFLHFLKFGLAVGVGGGLAGCLVGYYIAAGMTIMYRMFYSFPRLDNAFYNDIQASGLAISVVCGIIGSLHGTRLVLKLKPAEAMRAKPPGGGGAILLERIGWLWRRLNTGWRMVARNVIRNRMRTAAGIFAAAMGAALLSSGFMMLQGSLYLVDFQFKWVMRSDIDLTLKNERSEAALLEVKSLPGVKLAEPMLSVPGTFKNGSHRKKGAIVGLSRGAKLTVPRDLEARPIPVRGCGLTMSRKMAEILDVKRGDFVTFRTSKGLQRDHEVQVLEIAESYMGTAVYADFDYLNRLVGEHGAINQVQLLVDSDPQTQEALFGELKRLPSVQAVNCRSDMVKSIEDTLIASMIGFIGTLIIFSGTIFFGSILNSALIGLAERQREVATLRVLGYGPWQIGNLLFRESMIVTVIGTFVGMPIGYGLTVLMAISYDSELFRFPVVSTSLTWIFTAVLAILFCTMAQLFVQRTILNMDWLDALQSKE